MGELAIHMRSPDKRVLTDNRVPWWIMHLPLDMSNMLLSVPDVQLLDRFGSINQLVSSVRTTYTKHIKMSALKSVVIFYFGNSLMGIMSALVWLGRGPRDALEVCWESGGDSPLWWLQPLFYGMAEGVYRALAELVGNLIVFLVVILNTTRHIIIGTPRKRASGILDGFFHGFWGLVVDCTFTPSWQLLVQVRLTHQDWGFHWACAVFSISLIRIPLGPFIGVLHFLASVLEGIANTLLHEEAQFAPFEVQRTVESVTLDQMVDVAISG